MNNENNAKKPISQEERIRAKKANEWLNKYLRYYEDTEYIKNNFDIGADFELVGEKNNTRESFYENMRLMSACKHAIIANSSYSWWAAYLSDFDGKIVIAPTPWLNNQDEVELAKQLFHDAFVYAKAITEDDFLKGQNIELLHELKSDETLNGILSNVREAFYLGINLDEYVSTTKNLTFDSYQAFAESIDPDAMVTGILFPLSE